MRCLWGLGGVSLALAVLGCSSDCEDPAACDTSPEVGKTITSAFGTVSFKKEVLFPEDQPGFEGVDATGNPDGTETVTMRYSGKPPTFSAGDVIVGYKQEPYYFRRVIAVRPVAGGVQLDVELAALTDVVAEADVSAFLPINEDGEAIGSKPVDDEAMYTRGANEGTWTPFDLADQVIYEKKKSDGSHAVFLKTSPDSSLILAGGYEVNINVKWNEVYFYVKFHGGYELNLGLQGEVDDSGSFSYEHTLYPTGNDSWKTLARFSVAGIPLQLDFRLRATASAQVQAKGTFSANYASRRSYGFWFSMRNGTWNSDTIHTLDSEWHQRPVWDLEGTATLETGLKPTLALGLGGSYAGVGVQAHAGFNVHPKLRMQTEFHSSSTSASTLDWDLDGCLDLGVHASAEASFFKAKKEKAWEKVLWSGCLDLDEGTECRPFCDGKQCGEDGCGGVCGSHYGGCESGLVCQQGSCVCVPSCAGKVCGGDGCGGECPNGCVAQGSIYQCIESPPNNVCACIPDCTGKACGSDGCGAQCADTCGANERCNESNQCEPIPDECVSDCGARQCGRDPVCQRFCPLASDGQCSEAGDSCSSQGTCCPLVEEFHGPVAVAYSGLLHQVAAGPGGSSAQRVGGTGLGVLPSEPSVLRLHASGTGSILYGRSFDSSSLAVKDLPIRRLETMVWVDGPAALDPQSMVGAAFGFTNGQTVRWGIEFDNIAKQVRLRQGSSAPILLGTFENGRWYKLIARANDDFSQIYMEAVDVGGAWVTVTPEFSTTVCQPIVAMNPPVSRCTFGVESTGSVHFYLAAQAAVPQTVYFDDVLACR